MDRLSFLSKVERYHEDGYRLVMINATALKPGAGVAEDGCEIIWTFERANRLEHVRERVVPADEVPSVSAIYPFAHLYENEIRELFGLNVVGLNVDWKGQLYRTSQKVPLSPKAIRERLEASAAKAAAAKGAKGKTS
jgi:ech hydrogenase subunit D